MTPPPQEHANQLKVFLGSAELEADAAAAVESIVVDESMHLPNLFQVTFKDPDRKMLEKSKLKIGAVVKVKAFSPDAKGELLISAEVTSMEADYDPLGMVMTVRGLDKSARMMHGTHTEAYKKQTYSDVAKKVAARNKMKLGKVEATKPVHDVVTQANVSDWQFVRGMAEEVGFETFCVDDKFFFRKAAKADKAPAPGKMSKDPQPLQLVLGHNLLRVRAVVTAAEQVTEVQVRGWDPAKQKAVVGKSPAKATSAKVTEDPKKMAAKFGGKKYIGVHTPFTKEPEVKAAAEAIAHDIAGASAEIDGVARGNPKLRAGVAVSVGELEKPFDGKYLLTSTRHVWTPHDGYTTWFTAGGRQDRNMLSLTGGGGGGAGTTSAGPNNRVPGVVVGIVTNNKDPEKLGRVMVKFPWLDDKYQTDWARLVAAGAGKDRGMVIYPEVKDEVLVAFEQGDMRRPYVLGGLYSAKFKPKEGTGLVGATGVTRRGFISKKGHKLVFLDGPSKQGIMLSTHDKKFRFSLNATKQQVRVYSDNKIEIEAKNDILITSKMGNIKLKAMKNIEMDAKGAGKFKATMSLDLEATGNATLKGGPTTTIQGKLVNIN